MTEQTPKVKYRKDYTPPDYLIDHIDLRVDIHPDHTRVDSTLTLRRNPERPAGQPLVLDGAGLELVELRIDGRRLPADEYRRDRHGLTIPDFGDGGRVEIANRIYPATNTALEGLYQSGDILCTQCEAEGFRRITYFIDRPDVMATYTTTIVADRRHYPELLCNGNPVERGEDGGGRHWVRWDDPHPKPSYLFALVAGDLAVVEDEHVTGSGQHVALRLYVDPGNEGKCVHAMAALKAAMAWDERIYGLEYDLDVYMIVAVGAFNMGAMENKGLNLFNDKYVLADTHTGTDQDFANIEDVIGHEYFHNWTGNRVTLRDWFQLSLKESLTVFREQSFSADRGMAAIKRIGTVRGLRSVQFQEDAGPMAHPVRPESYIEMNNFYTMTIYQKGAEVIRMMHTLLGDEAFRRGVRLYLERHDGQAVTIEDFVTALEDASGIDLGQFRLWYSQAGTPELHVDDEYDGAARVYTLRVRQHCPPTPGQADKAPMHIPLSVGLRDGRGEALPLRLDGDDAYTDAPGQRVLSVRAAEETFRFENVGERPTPSLLRGFSAPVKLRYAYTADQLRFLSRHDDDAFCRWEATQQMLLSDILGAIERGGKPDSATPLADTLHSLLENTAIDSGLLAEMLALPSEIYIAEQLSEVNVDAVVGARERLRLNLANGLREPLLACYHATQPRQPYTYVASEAGRRRLHNLCLGYLCSLNEPSLLTLASRQFETTDNMTDAMGALAALNDIESDTRAQVFESFHGLWRGQALVMDKWLTLEATSRRPGALDRVRKLLHHEAFDLRNPNRVRALLGAFCMHNMPGFHQIDGAGYRLIADQVLALDRTNAQVAARLVSALARWRRYAGERGTLMKAQLERIMASPELSPDVYELASKSLQ